MSILKWVSLCLVLTGCTSLKKAAIVTGTVGVGAAVGALTGGVGATITGAMTSALVGDIATEILVEDMMECEPLGFFDLIGRLVEVGGWLLILIVIVPMVIGWATPGPLQLKKKSSS